VYLNDLPFNWKNMRRAFLGNGLIERHFAIRYRSMSSKMTLFTAK
jgi:hypothetical protein